MLELLKQRRIWASIFSTIAVMLSLFGSNLFIDANGLSDAIVNVIESISALMAIVLPIWSYLKPKQ